MADAHYQAAMAVEARDQEAGHADGACHRVRVAEASAVVVRVAGVVAAEERQREYGWVADPYELPKEQVPDPDIHLYGAAVDRSLLQGDCP